MPKNMIVMTIAWTIVLIASLDVGLSVFNFSLIGLLTNSTLITVFKYIVLISALYGIYTMFTMKHNK